MYRYWMRALSCGLALLLGAAADVHADPLGFSGTFSYQFGTLGSVVVPGAGVAEVDHTAGLHLLSLSLASGAFGPFATSLPLTAAVEASAVQLTLTRNLAGGFTDLSGAPPGGGAMGLQGVFRICVLFDCGANVEIPLTPTGTPAAGFGVGGTQLVTGALAFTLRHAPWTIGQPLLTIHGPMSTVTTPVLPGGFAHGPASATSTSAQTSGTLQLVTVSKAFTSLTGAFPELPIVGVLNLHFVPEPGTLVLLGPAALALLVARRRGSGRA